MQIFGVQYLAFERLVSPIVSKTETERRTYVNKGYNLLNPLPVCCHYPVINYPVRLHVQLFDGEIVRLRWEIWHHKDCTRKETPILFHEIVLNVPLELASLHSDFVLLCLSLQSDIGMKNIDSHVDINQNGIFQNAKKKNSNYF